MTYKESLQQTFPGAGKKRSGRQSVYGGACPGHYFEGGLTMESGECFGDCEACWEREMDELQEDADGLGDLLASGQVVRGPERL